MTKEGQSRTPFGEGEPQQPFELPDKLKEFLWNSEEYCMVHEHFDKGTVFVTKAPEYAIQGLRWPITIGVEHYLHRLPEAPVLRTRVLFYDDPFNPLKYETFFNVQAENQLTNFATLARQPNYIFAFYNQSIEHRMTKLMPNTHQEDINLLLAQAILAAYVIPLDHYDFETAKNKVQFDTPL